MAKKNFLLGKGERLTEDVRIILGGNIKFTPYTFSEAKNKSKLQVRISAKFRFLCRILWTRHIRMVCQKIWLLSPEIMSPSLWEKEKLRGLSGAVSVMKLIRQGLNM